ncbi:MAG: hypothetical protein HC890_17785 [Chloroflexaceae bacterium]|nr:hypothetical protein [Chloroflexaceae bacterium]
MSTSSQPRPLSLNGSYRCPVCRQGQLSSIPLMEAFGCSFCRHLFSVDEQRQLLKMADSQLPLSWYWDGQAWRGAFREAVEPIWFYWLAAAAFVLLPTGIIGFTAYWFPPLPGSLLSWLPLVWTPIAFFAHLTIVAWLFLQYYQFPLFLYLRAAGRRWFAGDS